MTKQIPATCASIDNSLDHECLFCALLTSRIQRENDLALAVFDAYPVTEGHVLIIPRRHVQDYWGLTPKERDACHGLLQAMREKLVKNDPTIEGFNIGFNAGLVAGQTVFHCHCHLIPRRQGDSSDPRGGIRHVIAGKGYYSSTSSPN